MTKILLRLATSDIVIDADKKDLIPKYITVLDKNGNELDCIEVYSIGYEDEDGNECDENGNY